MTDAGGHPKAWGLLSPGGLCVSKVAPPFETLGG
jgi:hypothetical protein